MSLVILQKPFFGIINFRRTNIVRCDGNDDEGKLNQVCNLLWVVPQRNDCLLIGLAKINPRYENARHRYKHVIYQG